MTVTPEQVRCKVPALGWLGVVAVSLGNFMVAFDASGVNVALPAIASDLGAGTVARQWILDAYTVPLCAVLLLAGVLGDRIGGTRLYRRATAVFAVVSLLCAVAPDSPTLIACRIVQGAAGGFMLPMTLSVISRRIGEPARRARAIGVWGVVGGVAIASAPLLASVLVAGLGWWSVFACNIPMCIAALLLLPAVDDREATTRSIDWRGQVLLAVLLSALACGVIESMRGACVVAGFAAAACTAAVAALVWHVRRAPAPMVPPEVFNRPFSVSVVAGTCYQFAAYGSLIVLPMYLQLVRRFDVVHAGRLMIPCCVGWLGGNVIALLAPHHLHRRFLSVAPAVAVVAAAVVAATAATVLPAALVATVPLGVTAGVLASTLSSTAMSLATPGTSGASAGTFNVGRQLGMVVAVAVLGSDALSASPVAAFSTIAGAFAVLGGAAWAALRMSNAQTEDILLRGRDYDRNT
ncbi:MULTISPECIES: MFS transporter [unclassified Gordonia (in: high G+C Gram-positive bacteria)]|uniref:MFS transporter n=1 Tax=unclassified Gordonia (in: high G+C Gram-positive bacteria) TaxID=2657482 RepID=UPI0009AD217F|nr:MULTISPECIES: MFS transporter [unclassified Gordonia (in: high G+C Gram-positive bacteria)]MDF3281364.1 MFS transporter [Gordonia sp. N1V]OPX09995.1 hypothetical protein B1964_24160 [Gordonia sp. i37]